LFILKQLKKMLKKNHKHRFFDFSTICYEEIEKPKGFCTSEEHNLGQHNLGQMIGSKIENFVSESRKQSQIQQKIDEELRLKELKLKKLKGKRADLFSNIIQQKIDINCHYCKSSKCENEKYENIGGSLLQFKNNSKYCPLRLYKQSLVDDQVLNKGLRTMKLKIKNGILKKTNKLQTIIVIRHEKAFDKKKHFIKYNPVSLKTTDGTTCQLFIDSNKIKLGDEEFNTIEFKDEKIPHILFLIETK